MLSAQYAVVALIALAINILMESPSKHPVTCIVLNGAFLLILFSLLLHRIGKHCTANIFLFVTLNVVIYLIGSSEILSTGAFLFSFPLSLAAFSVFNYKQRKEAILVTASSVILFGIALIQKVSILPFRDYTESQVQLIQLINFWISFPVSLMIVFLLIKLSDNNASSLKKANNQLLKLNEELDRFVYSTSHDLRAPLISVRGLLEIAKTATPEEQAKYFQLADKRLNSLDRFIMDITNFSRNNRLEIVREMVNVADLAADIWESLRYSPEAEGIEFINEIPQNLGVVNDGRRMKIVLTNLISNAIRYHDRRKTDKFIKLSYRATDTSFSLHVEDNGVGIAPELHTKIFDMFFRGTDKSQGSGLGLYIVKETLAKLSGQVQLTSAPRHGTTFSITLPK
jgi:signal transduction histidine kinase